MSLRGLTLVLVLSVLLWSLIMAGVLALLPWMPALLVWGLWWLP